MKEYLLKSIFERGISSDRTLRQIAVHYKPGTLGTILPALETEWEKRTLKNGKFVHLFQAVDTHTIVS